MANTGELKPMHTPMVASQKLTTTGNYDFKNPILYKSVVGALQYVTLSQLEISFNVNKVFQFMKILKLSHWMVVKRIL